MRSPSAQASEHLFELPAEGGEVSAVRRGERPDDDVHRWLALQEIEHMEAYELPQAAFHAIAIDRRVLVAGDDEPHPGERTKGSEGTHVQ